ncbi:MAG: 30S ribosomal protein S18 [Deltaproteobacteria bacterium]|nr:30S ribosomal protein S18 [Deltaproteobacteria bacterium]
MNKRESFSDRDIVPPGAADSTPPPARRGRRRGCPFCSTDAANPAPPIEYKDPQSLKYFVTERGKIVPRRISGVCSKHQRELAVAVKRARNIALLPFTVNE